MLTSMTGYGRGEARDRSMAIAVEVKTVNHRHLEVAMKLPGGLWEMEPRIQQRLREFLQRGRVEVFLHLLTPVAGTREPIVDVNLAEKYLKAIKAAGRKLGVPADLSLIQLAGLPEVVRVEDRPVPTQVVGGLVDTALRRALARLVKMRKSEGRKLAVDMRGRLRRLGRRARTIGQWSQNNLAEQEQKLKKKISSWMKKDSEMRRQIQDNCVRMVHGDITEELVRLASHLEHFEKFMADTEPAGRRMDFLIQEMNREINTIGSKATHAGMAHQVVACKEELEKIREQVQNIE